MTEASWGEGTMSPEIDWRMSAALENVPRGDTDVAEVTNLAEAVAAWQELDAAHRAEAVLTVEHALVIEGVSTTSFSGEGIDTLAQRLPTKNEAPS